MKTEKRLRHWLHIILALLTGGLWLAVYGILLSVNEMNNRVVRGYNQGWKDAHVSVGQRNAGMSWQALNRSSAGVPQAAMSAADAAEWTWLNQKRANGGVLTTDEQRDFDELRSRFA
jgi:hypothetical protein